MPYKGNGKEFSIRVPDDLWAQIEEIFANSGQSHLSKNDKVLSILKLSVNKYKIDKAYVNEAIENGRIPGPRIGTNQGADQAEKLKKEKKKSPTPK